MSDKQDTLDAVLSVPAAVQDAIDMLVDYAELFMDDEDLHEKLCELHEHLCEASYLSNTIRQRISR